MLQQALHPVVVSGFQAHSRWAAQPWSRLTRTADFVALATFGDSATVAAAAAGVRRGHRHEFTDPQTGRTRRLDEPELLAWVHCCLVDSFLDVSVRAGLRLSAAEQDTFVAEQVRFGELVGLQARDLPQDRAELAAYFAAIRPSLRLTPPACDAVATLLAAPLPPSVELLTPARLGWTALGALAVGSLPPWARAMFPIPIGVEPLTAGAVTAGLRALRLTTTGLRVAVPGAGRGPHERAARARLRVA